MTQPLVYVSAPSTTPYRYGLFSAAAVVDPADQREFQAGVEWEPVCVDAPAATTSSAASDPSRPTKSLSVGVSKVTASPVLRLYAGVEADLTGRDDHLERARTALGLVEQQSLEHYAWTGSAGNRPRLADPATPILAGSDASPVSLATAVGLLEEHISDRSGVLGALWVPRKIGAHLAAADLTRLENPRMVAPLGNPYVFAHTNGAGPAGAAASGEAWLYGTGPVMVRRSQVTMPRLAEAHDRTTNDVFAIAERFYTIGWSCTVVAVKVQLPAEPA
ncbi:hypothetical protein ACQEVC_34210 [Plantactinospora sp. CA-294935]|uniref:hypothetical protein n=1 Tax=Plantactinospora sp. CA-294935 TaxID=3240012 RepID=UPI003D90F2E2